MFTIYFSQLKFELNLGPSLSFSSIQFSRSDALRLLVKRLDIISPVLVFVNRLFLTFFRAPLPQRGVISRFFRFADLPTGYRVYLTKRLVSTSNPLFLFSFFSVTFPFLLKRPVLRLSRLFTFPILTQIKGSPSVRNE